MMPDGELRDWLEASLAAARSAWPDVSLSDEVFVAHVAAKIAARPDGTDHRARHTSDLFLACACLHRCPRALECFAKRYEPSMLRVMARAGVSGPAADDLVAALREKLFFGAEPRIAEYSGLGSLAAWVRAVAHNAALNENAAATRNVDLDEILDAPDVQVDPELGYLKTRYAAEFKTSLAHAAQTLSPRERNLLRQHYVDGSTVDELGRIHGVHRATAAEWVVKARQALAREVRRDLAKRLSLSARELESLLRMLRSDVRSGITGVLR
jgi:RNA polymerase sigma-70 factor (ECF subfamily)